MTLDGEPVEHRVAVDAPAGAVHRRRQGRTGAGCASTCWSRAGCDATSTWAAPRRSRSGASAAYDGRALTKGDVLALGAARDAASRRARADRAARADPRLGARRDRGPARGARVLHPRGHRRVLRDRLGGPLQLRPHRRAAGRARARAGRARTAARPACTRRTSTTPPTASARSTSPATRRCCSVPTVRASAGSSARPRSSRDERWKLGQLRPGDRVRFAATGPARRRRPRPARGVRRRARGHLPALRATTTCSSSTARWCSTSGCGCASTRWPSGWRPTGSPGSPT